MAPQKATLHSMVNWVNYVQMIAIIYPQNLFQLLRIPWSFILEWNIWLALIVTKDYEYTVGISRDLVDPRFASWKIGPLNQARWLTLAIRLMCLWTCGAYPQNLSTKLYSLIDFIVNVYAICWFDIKKSNKFHHQQIYIYNMIDRIRKKPIEVQRITLKKPPV